MFSTRAGAWFWRRCVFLFSLCFKFFFFQKFKFVEAHRAWRSSRRFIDDDDNDNEHGFDWGRWPSRRDTSQSSKSPILLLPHSFEIFTHLQYLFFFAILHIAFLLYLSCSHVLHVLFTRGCGRYMNLNSCITIIRNIFPEKKTRIS